MWAGEGMLRRADSAAWPLAVGPRAQEEAAEQAAGCFMLLGRLMKCFVLLFFSIFQKQFQ